MSAGARATRRSTACPATTSVPVTPAGRKRRILRRQRRGQRRGHRQHHSASRRGLHCAPPCTRTQDSAVSSHESHITLTGYGSEQAITSSPVGAPKNPPPLAPMTTYCLPSRPTYVEGVPCDGTGSLSRHSSVPVRATETPTASSRSVHYFRRTARSDRVRRSGRTATSGSTVLGRCGGSCGGTASRPRAVPWSGSFATWDCVATSELCNPPQEKRR